MNCYSCAQQNWESFGDINKERELLCCKNCGALAFRVDPSKEEETKEYYRHQYRPAPNVMNLITTAHKRAYIDNFLSDFLRERDRSVTGRPLVCGDVGCATGYIPQWLRAKGHKATGCELTVTYRRFAEHFYSVPVTEELDPAHKYDLITIYHVLEHLIAPDAKMKHYASLLADGGRILVSVPEWMRNIEEGSGATISGFDVLFHKDHINVFTERSLKNLFARAGLTVEKEDHAVYGQTYFLKAGTPTDEIMREDYRTVMDHVRMQKAAIDLFMQGKIREALRVYPRFPDAWIRLIHGDSAKDRNKQGDLFNEAFQVLPDNLKLKLSFATWLYMGEELQQAVAAFDELLAIKPGEDVYIFRGWALAKLGRRQEAMESFNAAAVMNPMKWAEAMNAIAKCAVELPCWEERAVEEAKKALFAQSGIKPVLTDPVMRESAGAKT